MLLQRVQAPNFELADVEAIKQGIPGIFATPVSFSGALLMYGSTARTTSITGTDNEYLRVRAWKLEAGRTFFDSELLA